MGHLIQSMDKRVSTIAITIANTCTSTGTGTILVELTMSMSKPTTMGVGMSRRIITGAAGKLRVFIFACATDTEGNGTLAAEGKLGCLSRCTASHRFLIHILRANPQLIIVFNIAPATISGPLASIVMRAVISGL